MTNFSEEYYKFSALQDEFEESLYAICPLEYIRMWCDYYDNSIEFKDLQPEERLNAEACKYLHDNGFSICFLNHSDGWETHYSSLPTNKEWRIRYNDKHGGDGILVENELPKSWIGSVNAAVVVVPK